MNTCKAQGKAYTMRGRVPLEEQQMRVSEPGLTSQTGVVALPS